MPPAGGSRPLYGTNPVAFGWPRDGKPPLVFDQSSAACARGEIMIRERDGAPLPPGWAVDRDGQPTTDPRAALEGAQLPFGGYKGANIALMVELLAGALVGDLFSFEATELDPEDSDVTTGGEFMIAIDPGRCLDGRGRKRQLAHAEQLFERVLEQDGARLPSDRRCAARQRSLENGIAIPRSLYDDLQQLIGGQ